MPWLCVGNFNEIVNLLEIKGATYRSQRQMDDFQQALEDCQLCDLGFKGPKFTWDNGREWEAFTKKWLDRAFANAKWRAKFVDVKVLVVARSFNNHPLLISVQEKQLVHHQKARPFRMEVSWTKRANFSKAIRAKWVERQFRRNPWINLKENMKTCKKIIQV
jgi:hypothetical protein